MERNRDPAVCPDRVLSRSGQDKDFIVGEPPGGVISVAGAQLPASPVAIGVHGRLGHPELSGDLFRAEMPIDQTEALALPARESFDRIITHIRASRIG